MSKDFIGDFKKFCRKLDEPKPTMHHVDPERGKLFNIHKRSLPVGIDVIILFNLSKDEADWWVEHRLHTKCYDDAETQSKTVIYYDVLPVGASPKEKNVYRNDVKLIADDPYSKAPKRIN